MSWAVTADAENGTPTSVVRLSGEFDMDARDALGAVIRQAVADHRSRAVTIDLSAVTFLDSEALGALIDGWQVARNAGKGYRVVHATGLVRRVLQVAGIFDV
jgi:anti-anti-sigma factor